MVTTRISSAFATIAVAETNSSVFNSNDTLVRQYVSGPIVGDQTISGTLKGQMSMSESNVSANFNPQIFIRVVSNNGSTVRGTLYAGHTATNNPNEITTTLRNWSNPLASVSPVTLSSVSALDGDRIVAEIGGRAHNTVTTNYTISVRFGDNAGSDLTEGGAETTDLNPWIEFSTDIVFTATPLQTLTRTQQRYTYY